MGKTFVMGDIHGNNRGLIQCLIRSGFDNNTDRLIQVGDVADGWPETSECVDTLLSIRDLIAIRGNHDVWVYDWIKKGDMPIMWTQQGGQATIDSYVSTGMILNREHQQFWDDQKDWYIDEENRLFIHGGWDAFYGFPKGASLAIPRGGSIARECHWNRALLQKAKSGSIVNKETGKPMGLKALEQFKEVYIGHTGTDSGLPENYLNLWNLDTGSGWYGKLTIMDIDTKEYWQSDGSKELYPNVKGRE